MGIMEFTCRLFGHNWHIWPNDPRPEKLWHIDGKCLRCGKIFRARSLTEFEKHINARK